VLDLGLMTALGNILYHRWYRPKSKHGLESPDFTRTEWLGVAVICILAIPNFFFWLGFEQAGGTFTLFAKDMVDRTVHIGKYTFEIPASIFGNLNSLFVVFLSRPGNNLWAWNDKRTGWKLTTPMKLGLGLIFLGLGFVVMYFGQQAYTAHHHPVSKSWLVAVYFLHTVGELCLSPIGLAMVQGLAPKRITPLMIGVWYGSSALGNYGAGMMESYTEALHIGLWTSLSVLSFLPGIAMFLFSHPLTEWMARRENERKQQEERALIEANVIKLATNTTGLEPPL
jgi:POT family proton-dependent oligopeptide transporter